MLPCCARRSELFRCLSAENVLLLFAAVLAERRILFVSARLKTLTLAAEAICSLLFPLFWRHIYIPVRHALLCGLLFLV